MKFKVKTLKGRHQLKPEKACVSSGFVCHCDKNRCVDLAFGLRRQVGELTKNSVCLVISCNQSLLCITTILHELESIKT